MVRVMYHDRAETTMQHRRRYSDDNTVRHCENGRKVVGFADWRNVRISPVWVESAAIGRRVQAWI
jgi:hypothetical protein